MVPNPNNIIKWVEHAHFRQQNVKTLKVRKSTLAVQGASLSNVMPKRIRKLKDVPVHCFKNTLDSYLKSASDEPQVCGYTILKS